MTRLATVLARALDQVLAQTGVAVHEEVLVAAIPEPERSALEAALDVCQYPGCGVGEGDTLHHHLAGFCDPDHAPMFSCHPYQPLVPLGDAS